MESPIVRFKVVAHYTNGPPSEAIPVGIDTGPTRHSIRRPQAMPALAHSFKTLRREWRSGELRLIAAALIVAVAAVTAVTLFTDRVRQAMVLRANTLLAADLALDSSFPIALPYLEEARRLGLETAQKLSFRSMLDFQGPCWPQRASDWFSSSPVLVEAQTEGCGRFFLQEVKGPLQKV